MRERRVRWTSSPSLSISDLSRSFWSVSSCTLRSFSCSRSRRLFLLGEEEDEEDPGDTARLRFPGRGEPRNAVEAGGGGGGGDCGEDGGEWPRRTGDWEAHEEEERREEKKREEQREDRGAPRG